MKNSPNHHLIHYTASLAKEGERQTAAGGCSTFSVEGRMSRARSPYFFTFHRTQQLRNWKKDGTRPGVCVVTVATGHMLLPAASHLLRGPSWSEAKSWLAGQVAAAAAALARGGGGGCWEGEGASWAGDWRQRHTWWRWSQPRPAQHSRSRWTGLTELGHGCEFWVTE